MGCFFWPCLRVGLGCLIEYWCEVLSDVCKVGVLPKVVRKLLCWFIFAAQLKQIIDDNNKHYFWKKTLDGILNLCCSLAALFNTNGFIWFQFLLWRNLILLHLSSFENEYGVICIACKCDVDTDYPIFITLLLGIFVSIQ